MLMPSLPGAFTLGYSKKQFKLDRCVYRFGHCLGMLIYLHQIGS